MSASKEEKTQREVSRAEQRRREEKADRRAMALYTTIGVVVVLAAAIALLLNSGILQRSLTALEINGTKYTAADVQYYYSATYADTVNTVYNQTGTLPFDTSVSVKKQVYDQETGETWYDYLMDLTRKNLTTQTALNARAESEGYVLSEEDQSELDSLIAQLDTVWVGKYPSRSDYIRAVFGPHMTYDRLCHLLRQEMVASAYVTSALDSIEHTDADYEAYYQEHKDDLDTFTYTQFAIRSEVSTRDEEGNDLGLTDEEIAAQMEEAKAESKALAEEIQSRLEAGEDPAVLAEEYADRLYSATLDRKLSGARVASLSSYADWIRDDSRREGDIVVEEYEAYDTIHYYYVALWQGRERDETPTADIRHILVAAEQDEGADEPTQEQYDAAYEEAEALLKEWKDGEATEDSFAALATTESADPGSAKEGGLYTNVSVEDGFISTFTDWALDPARQSGDTGIVQNTGSSTKGWHIMYFVEGHDPLWKQTAIDALTMEDYESLEADVTKDMTAADGMGMHFITA